MKHASKRPTKSLRIIFAFLLIIQPILIMSLEGIDSIKYILVLSSVPLIAIYALIIKKQMEKLQAHMDLKKSEIQIEK